MRRAAKRDANEMQIAGALRLAGCRVMFLSDFDLLVCRGKQLTMLEVKTRTGRLTTTQCRLLADGWPLHVVRSVDDALAVVGLAKG